MEVSQSSPGKKKMTKREQALAKKAAAKMATVAASPTVSPNPPELPPDVSMTHEQVHRASLLASITGQQFENVKFFAFSWRTRNGAVDTPRPLIANSRHVRKVSPHFNIVFGAGFAESELSNMDAPYPFTRPSTTDSYDYSSDSDLDDDEDNRIDEPSGSNEAGAASASVGNTEEAESDAKDKDKEEVDDECQPTTVGRRGRVVYLEDIAYTTWKAFIYYAYFQELNFAPLKSQMQSRLMLQDPYAAPLCSPKSMYRVAHKYDIPTLKEKAINDIKTKLNPLNILNELFSSFTSLYSDIRDVELEYLHSNVKDAGIQARLPVWLEMLEKNQLPCGSSVIFASLFSKLSIGAATVPKKCPRNCGSSTTFYCSCCGSFK